MSLSKEKEKAVEGAIAQIEREFGKGSIMRLGDKGRLLDVRVIPTGAFPLDLALGVGGIPRGRITEIYGPEASGKTTLALHVVAEAQREGGVAAFIDAEHALDPVYARKLGVKTEDLLISQPDTGEQALEIAETLVRSGAVDVVVIDSVAALVPRAELEGDMGDSHVGLQARLMSQALRKLTATIGKTNTMMIFINQIRIMGLLEGDITLSENGVARAFREPAIKVDKQSTYQKEQILLCYLLTIPGVPIVFYGDEFGMTGANDPDNRRMMRFDDELSAQEKAQLLVFSTLSKIRNQFACLRRGDYLNLYTDKNVMVYSRGDSDNRLIIAFNKCQKDKNIVISPPGWMTIPSLEPLIGTVTSDIEGGKVSLIIPALGYGILQIK